MDENTPIEYRWYNMDKGVRTTEENLRSYERALRAGLWRTDTTKTMYGGPVLMGYGINRFDHMALVTLDRRLSQDGEG